MSLFTYDKWSSVVLTHCQICFILLLLDLIVFRFLCLLISLVVHVLYLNCWSLILLLFSFNCLLYDLGIGEHILIFIN